MPELSRWNDDRLDELATAVRRNAERLEENALIRVELVELRERLTHVSGDTHECVDGLRDLKAQLERREQQQHDERKADRKWMIATLLATATLIVGALAVFVG